jgi:hypothetical protein
MKKMSKIVTIRIITVLFLASLPFLGSDCEDVLNVITQPPTGNIQGSWTLIYNAGTTLDICPGETVSYPSSSGGTATLQCPDQSAVDRDYTVSGSTLTYTSSGMQYEVSFTQDSQLVLSGVNNNRLLYYTSGITSDKKTNDGNVKTDKNAVIHNSSEIIK